MKKLILILFSIFCIGLVQAGSLELYFNGEALQPGATILVIGDPTDDYIQAKVDVKNISGNAIDVKAKKVIHEGDTLAGTMNYFCWGLCFPPFTYNSPNSLNIAPGAVNEEFYGDYQPLGVIGVSKITYVFYDMNNTNDSVAVQVEYKASPASVGNQYAGVKFSEAYPNPAISMVNVDFTLTGNITRASVVVSNMLGCRVKEITLTHISGRIQIPVSELGNGIYFYSLVGNDQVLFTRKFVVKR